ncbi:ligase-associated DNA damage response endonuclease PdeM [Methyloversatilis thermotolerans]|uniref:ligase-associated DNA damage response endonuclease PdeM n=1 Tax=Methyloversatilis thermotolerans TaxID=1346290 RepID=UPI00036B966D|nr:ligase-associated DNA damage response endonuclease PdeM [Methyloversatilis thermotolerans]
MKIELCGEQLELLAERALWWPAQSALLVADAHVGKGSSFRALGVPVPDGSSSDTLARLAALLHRTGARRLVFLGDLLHARNGCTPALMAQLAALHRDGCDWLLVRGNHDAHAGIPQGLPLSVVDEGWRIGPFALCHHPEPVAGAYVLAGHVHPAVRIEAAGDRLRLPCFALGQDVGLLPAFGSFTGHATLEHDGTTRLYACAGDHVFEVPATPPRRRGNGMRPRPPRAETRFP